jgi:hypothetical protein
MTRDEEILAKVMQERGYLVFRTNLSKQPGERIPSHQIKFGGRAANVGQHFYVISETDVQDLREQCRMFRELGKPEPLKVQAVSSRYLYRISTD